MKIDPNSAVEMRTEYVLCEGGRVLLHDGSSTARDELGTAGNGFDAFCRSLDPNKCFIVALIPDDGDRAVYFRAREIASGIGIHMQAPVETPLRLRSQWDNYCRMKQLPSITEDDS
jgi:hypothetical protein